MIRNSAGDYTCDRGELIEIRFFCVPSRANLHIRVSNDGINYSNMPNNSIRFMFDRTETTIWLQYAFLNQGTCVNQIIPVSNTPSKDDRITAMATAGRTDTKILVFRPV